jgi:hypothetical protein
LTKRALPAGDGIEDESVVIVGVETEFEFELDATDDNHCGRFLTLLAASTAARRNIIRFMGAC